MRPTVRRPDMANLFHVMEGLVGPGDTLTRDFLHMPAGTPYGEAASWFRKAHAELDAVEPCLVEIRTKGVFRDARTTLRCSRIEIYRDALVADGKDHPGFMGHTVVAITWTSGRGTVAFHPNESLFQRRGRVRVEGMVNGVDTRL